MGLFDPRVQNNNNWLIFKIRGQFISDINIIKLLTYCLWKFFEWFIYVLYNEFYFILLPSRIHSCTHFWSSKKTLLLCVKQTLWKNYLNSLPLPLSPFFSPRCGIASLSITGLISKMSASNTSWQIDFQVKIPHVWNITKRTFSYLGD